MFGKIFSFFGETKQEIAKIVWPGKQETVRGAVMIFAFSVLFALFFLAVDRIITWMLGFIFS
ncbi:MAG: preprotein translocase subunit SecE [Rickettsiales bacterium]|jgi:preprotein translocase subunit SecE|nr:preprotein translocase subunit SecE [Rickettsiales bacterium]